MHISNRFVVVCTIQIVIRMLYGSFKTLIVEFFLFNGKNQVNHLLKLDLVTNNPFLFILWSNPPLIRIPHLIWDPRVKRVLGNFFTKQLWWLLLDLYFTKSYGRYIRITNIPTNICLFKADIEAIEKGVKCVQI